MSTTFHSMVYKIAPSDSWDAGLPNGRYDGSADDARDGFIHLSTADQVRATAAKYFAGQSDLVVAAIDVAKLGDTLKWEPARDGAVFPHVYGPIQSDQVIWTKSLPLDDAGNFIFPREIA
jgi:uncharacterized protein (DUF952 family)